MSRTYEIRCPLHGFIPIDDWERDIINHRVFQRLRRIRQLAWTDQVYPGTMHTRFEHSLGVMHVASEMYKKVVDRNKQILIDRLGFDEDGFKRDHRLVRLAALLHDVGHSPFSHAAEDLFPLDEAAGRRYRHEDYSAALIRGPLRDVIDNHRSQGNCGYRADDVAALIEGSTNAGRFTFWREIISGQLDADRTDYLLRDSLHAGVSYGRFDWQRLLNSLAVAPSGRDDTGGYRLAVDEGGTHAAEGLVLARYFMFTQVYFHKTRVAFDRHLQLAMSEILPNRLFPAPMNDDLNEFVAWDDWKVLGELAGGNGGEHGRRLSERDHYREVYHTPEVPTIEDHAQCQAVREGLGNLIVHQADPKTSWYKVSSNDILVASDNPGGGVRVLSEYSPVVGSIKAIGKTMLFSEAEHAAEARDRVARIVKEAKP